MECCFLNLQAALPQGIVPFVFAKEYNVHPDILSTGFELKPFLPFLACISQANSKYIHSNACLSCYMYILFTSIVSLFHVSTASFDAWLSFARVSGMLPPM